jgi:pimeloyl-ACP methyl ester carboxylesterase
VPILPVEIPYENTTLPGYFHRVDESDTSRPLLILHTGFDGSAEEMHGEGARAGVERGWNVLVFDGPGQYVPIHRERLPFRPDWEKVVTPVVDFALTLPGVDPEKIALMGVSFGGYLAPRAAAFEKRISALVANDGIYDFGVTQPAAIPPDQRASFIAAVQQKDAPELDRKIVEASNKSSAAKWGSYPNSAISVRQVAAAERSSDLSNANCTVGIRAGYLRDCRGPTPPPPAGPISADPRFPPRARRRESGHAIEMIKIGHSSTQFSMEPVSWLSNVASPAHSVLLPGLSPQFPIGISTPLGEVTPI